MPYGNVPEALKREQNYVHVKGRPKRDVVLFFEEAKTGQLLIVIV